MAPRRLEAPPAWSAGGKIPWQEPSFSARMLREHLSQEHDRASRRFEMIDHHVAWLHDVVLGGRAARILDLGCGPGLYTERLARLGHSCLGIDFSPAAIAHARGVASAESLDCTYREQDLREIAWEGPFDLVLMLFGELNAFARPEALSILHAAARALAPQGELVVELHELDWLRRAGERAAFEYQVDSGLFSERPYRCVQSAHFDRSAGTLVESHEVFAQGAGASTEYVSTLQGYSREEYELLFNEAALRARSWLDGFGDSTSGTEGLSVVRLDLPGGEAGVRPNFQPPP